MTIPPALEMPDAADGSVFAEPWQARAFALVVTLCREGHYEWDDFRSLLMAEIAAADSAGDGETDYYSHWLAAAERLLTARGLVAGGDLTLRKNHLAAHPPHPTKTVSNPVFVDPGRR